MISIFKKIIFGLIIVATITLLGILGFNVYLNYKNNLINRQKLDLKYGLESERKKRLADEESRREREERLQQAALDKAYFNAEGKASILTHKTVHHLGIRPTNGCGVKCDDKTGSAPTLIFTKKVNNYLFNVLRDMTDFRNKNGVLEPDGYNDKNYSPFLKRNNAVMYGAPGTGKTELINELVHHLHKQFHNPKIDETKKEIDELEKRLEADQKKYEQEKNPNIIPQEDPQFRALQKKENGLKAKKKELEELKKNNMIPPIIEIKGATLQSAGEALKDLNPEQKLIKIIQHYKKKAFGGDGLGDEPYIVFIEEADQGINVLGKSGRASEENKSLLEEYKNFLSTSEDKLGLKAKAQDPNSIILIATNNFESIDPAVVRRGRLGEKLNFNWNPALLEQYGKEGDNNWELRNVATSDWPVINWPQNDPGWKFVGNPNYWDLFAMSAKFGYASFCNHFARNEKANKIIKSYNNLPNHIKETKEIELGFFKTGNKITKKNSNGENEEEDERACNWVLHFLYTFHRFNDASDLDSFTSAEDIRRYDFGDAFFTREALVDIYKQIGAEVKVINVTKNVLTELVAEAKNIYKVMLETANVRQEVANLKAAVKDVENSLLDKTSQIQNNIKTISDGMERLAQRSSNSGDVSALANRVANLEKNLSTGGSGSKSGLSSPIEELRLKIRELISTMGSNSQTQALQEAFSKLIDAYNS